jgi:hypothetical protein
MITENSIYFEINGNGNFIQIELSNFDDLSKELSWSENWIKAIVYVKAGAFSGNFRADFTTWEFITFKKELILLYEKLTGSATFDTLEKQVVIKVSGDGIGHLKADCVLEDNAGFGNRLQLEIDFDQTSLPNLIRQLEIITAKFEVS